MSNLKKEATDIVNKHGLNINLNLPDLIEDDTDSGSTYKVPLTQIVEVKPHPNADRLEIAVVYGFDVVVKKGQYTAGDKVVYVPIDSILPLNLEEALFPPTSKITLKKHRVRQIRIRKYASQGMLISPEEIQRVYGFEPNELEKDYAGIFNIVKYEPPAPKYQKMGTPGQRKKKKENSNFHQYNGLDNIKWYPNLFTEEDIVVIQEKIHGTNARAALMPFEANTIWKKILKFLGLAPKFQFCYGSNRVQLQDKEHSGFYEEDVYHKVLVGQLDAESKLQPGEAIYGEIYGDGIQKNYNYGLTNGKLGFVLFDVKVLSYDGTQRWLSPDEVKKFAEERGFDMVPELYRGPFNMELAKELTKGNSVFCPAQKIREGVVVKAVKDYCTDRNNKKALKVISEEYLDKNNSDFH